MAVLGGLQQGRVERGGEAEVSNTSRRTEKVMGYFARMW